MYITNILPKQSRDRERIKPLDGKNGSYYYNSKYWKSLRNRFIRLYPLCEDCLKEGRSIAAEEIHHNIPFMRGKTEEERWDLLLDPNNLSSLCIKHHQLRHEIMNRQKYKEDQE